MSWGISSSSGLYIKLSQAIGSGIHIASGGFLTKRYEFCYAKKLKSNGERTQVAEFGRKRTVAKKELIGSTNFPNPIGCGKKKCDSEGRSFPRKTFSKSRVVLAMREANHKFHTFYSTKEKWTMTEL